VSPSRIPLITRRLTHLCLAAGAAALLAGALLGQRPLAASFALGLAAGLGYFRLLGWDAARRGKSGIMNAVIVLMAKGRFLIVIGAALAAAQLPPLGLPGTLAGLAATQVAFLVAIRRLDEGPRTGPG